MASTQQRYPWRAVLRTVVSFLTGLAVVWPVVVELLGLDRTWQWVSATLVVSAGVTRLLADPRILRFLERFAPWLLPEPKADDLAGRGVVRLGRR